MSPMKDFAQAAPRVLPVILLADTSGSMGADGKIEAMNESVRQMLDTFRAEKTPGVEIHTCVITFGDSAVVHTALQPAQAVRWEDMRAYGSTPMGAAMALAAGVLEDEKQIPRTAFRPTVVLVSDGQPTDQWEAGLNRITREGRAQKADRMALAIGADASEGMLARFIGDPEKPVFKAEDARMVRSFFRFLSQTQTARSRSANPNLVPKVGDPFVFKKY